MAYLSGILHRPMSAVAAVAVAAVSWDIPDPFSSTTRLKPIANVPPPVQPEQPEPTVSQIASSKFLSRIGLAAGDRPITPITRSMLHDTPVASTASLMTIYRYARLAKPSKDREYVCPIHSTSSTEVVYRWHLPDPGALDKSGCAAERSRTVVVLLGWLGAKQRHLKRYADWYTKRGFHVVTFTFPMADIISYKSGGKAEENTELLASHLVGWVAEESGKNLVFHTFSNTGWLTYGVLLEKFQKHDPSVMGKIKGCIVDSAPVAAPDPQVWASGFSAAILKKQSVATKSYPSSDVMATVDSELQPKPAIAETALLVVLEKFFEVVLNLPGISRRLTDVLKLLSSEQPKCPQLYIYSSADRVIPATSVESFIERQRRAGHEIRACDFINSPHVDHYRSHPTLYTSQLTAFLEDCVLNCSDGSSQ